MIYVFIYILYKIVSCPNIQAPYFFQIQTPTYTTICGVLEFSAREGTCLMTSNMLNMLSAGGIEAMIKYVPPPPQGTFVKFQPMKKEFIELSNPKAVLERSLIKYCCLTKGEIIQINYIDIIYELKVVEVKSGSSAKDTVNIIDSNLDLEFEAPVDYVEPAFSHTESSKESVSSSISIPLEDSISPTSSRASSTTSPTKKFQRDFVPFTGEGYRLDGRIPPSPQTAMADDPLSKYGTVIGSSSSTTHSSEKTKPKSKFAKKSDILFSGTGHSLK